MAKREHDRIRPLEALRALRALGSDPDDTAQVFRLLRALPNGDRVFRRFRRTETGARLLSRQPSLLAALSDREALRALPAGSLGRRYAEFMATEQISAGGLVDASVQGSTPDRWIDEDHRFVGERLRDMHDLWHVVTGYSRDLLGEASLLAFTFAQTRTPGIGVIVGYALWKVRAAPEARRMIWQGFRRGRRAAWLPAQEWEELLCEPLEAVRERLAVGSPPAYSQVRSQGAPAPA
jgi:ubiquinone biosynthesis protein COQ4